MTKNRKFQSRSIDTIIIISVKTSFKPDDPCWQDRYIDMANVGLTQTITTIGTTKEDDADDCECFDPLWLQILDEDDVQIYSGCPIEFGLDDSDPNSAFTAISASLSKGDPDQHHLVSYALVSLLSFIQPADAMTNFDVAGYSVGDSQVDLDDAGIADRYDPRLLMYACRSVARFAPTNTKQPPLSQTELQDLVSNHVDDWDDANLRLSLVVSNSQTEAI